MADNRDVEAGTYLRARLAAAQISQAALADRMRIRPSAVNQWITGASRPSIERIVELAEIIEEDPVNLMAVWWPQLAGRRADEIEIPQVTVQSEVVDVRLSLISAVIEMSEADAAHLLELIQDLDDLRTAKDAPGHKSAERSS